MKKHYQGKKIYKKKENPNIIRFNLSFLPLELYVCFSENGFEYLCKKKKYNVGGSYLENDAMTRICTEKGKEPVIAMCFDLKKLQKLDKCVSAGLVVHEATHTLSMICEQIGQENRKDNEWEAYLIQQIVVDVLSFVYREDKGE